MPTLHGSIAPACDLCLFALCVFFYIYQVGSHSHIPIVISYQYTSCSPENELLSLVSRIYTREGKINCVLELHDYVQL